MINMIDKSRAGPLRLMILDIDGVMTDGRIVYSSDGNEIKHFHVHDGSGLKYWQRAGHLCAIISGRESPIIPRRAGELGITEVHMGAKDKLPVLEAILGSMDIKPDEAVYVGDDLPDIPPMRHVGLSVAVANAVAEVREFADVVTERSGGNGAVRELVEALLKLQGRWDGILARYFPENTG